MTAEDDQPTIEDNAPLKVSELKFEPKTAEQITAEVARAEFAQDLIAVQAIIAQEMQELAKLKLMAKLLPAGGIGGNLNQIRGKLAEKRARLNILTQLWIDLQAEQPIPEPSGIEVPTLVIREDGGPNRQQRRHGRG